jgi:hypothetical protein
VTGNSIRVTWEAERRALQPLPMTLPQPFDVQFIDVSVATA